MIKILLCCAGGMSTSFIVKKMETVAEKRGIEAEIKAVGSFEVEKLWRDYDVVLVGPQVRFEVAHFKELFQGQKPIGLISPQVYGTMNGEKILNQALELIGK